MQEKRQIGEKYKMISWALDERMKRLWAATEAASIGHGGVSEVSDATGISRRAIHCGARELALREIDPPCPSGRIRKKGGGRKKTTIIHGGILEVLESMVEPASCGDPENPLRWTCKSLRQLSEELKRKGFEVSHPVVGELLKSLNYSLQSNQKTLEGGDHPDRNAQFEHINKKVKKFLSAGNPVISVDAKKKELIGNFKNGGREWQPQGSPRKVKVYDFMDKKLGRATPYGIYDLGKNSGWVSVGVDHDTSEFAVETIRRWWKTIGENNYPDAKELLITADGGGSNGSRVRLWKLELQKLATEIKLPICVCHFPPGTSKWNKIEHCLFSFISMNWRGTPLISREVMVRLIERTSNRSGLKVKASIDKNSYSKGKVVSDEEFDSILLRREKFHGDWNYMIVPSCQP